MSCSSEVLVATVVNFPAGDDAVNQVVAETEAALAAGADEIDVVMPYRAFLEDRVDEAAAMIDAVRAVIDGDHALKVIIESGAMSERAQVDAASRLAVDHGADFVKTSTGKIDVSATPEAAETILGVLSTADRPVGIKVAGGVRSLDDAAEYLALADRIMGDGWASPATFRFGSSSSSPPPARPSPPTSRPPRPSQRRPAREAPATSRTRRGESEAADEPATSTGSASDESPRGTTQRRDEGAPATSHRARRSARTSSPPPASRRPPPAREAPATSRAAQTEAKRTSSPPPDAADEPATRQHGKRQRRAGRGARRKRSGRRARNQDSHMRRVVLAAAGVLLVVLSTVGFGRMASAHTELESASPAPDSTATAAVTSISLTFTQAVTPAEPAIQLFDEQGRPVAVGPVTSSPDGATITTTLPQPTGNGRFGVLWQIVSTDGHTLSDSFEFVVGAPVPTTTTAPPTTTTTAPPTTARADDDARHDAANRRRPRLSLQPPAPTTPTTVPTPTDPTLATTLVAGGDSGHSGHGGADPRSTRRSTTTRTAPTPGGRPRRASCSSVVRCWRSAWSSSP
ncbi:MAG: deoxyribose-phosphate aldolase [Ilumatobacteraceae bacterium]